MDFTKSLAPDRQRVPAGRCSHGLLARPLVTLLLGLIAAALMTFRIIEGAHSVSATFFTSISSCSDS